MTTWRWIIRPIVVWLTWDLLADAVTMLADGGRLNEIISWLMDSMTFELIPVRYEMHENECKSWDS